jgi:hypothetical protein
MGHLLVLFAHVFYITFEEWSTNAPLATFTRRGGVLTLTAGRTLLWMKPGFWKSKRVWSDGAASLIEFDPASGYASPQVTITEEGARLADTETVQGVVG